MKTILLLCFFGMSTIVCFAQCPNSVSIKRAQFDKTATGQSKGILEVAVSAGDSYSCTLYKELGKGPELVTVKRSQGNAVLRFESIDPLFTYQVTVEFNNSPNPACKRLQKSNITIQ
jgi:hypothetical protein